MCSSNSLTRRRFFEYSAAGIASAYLLGCQQRGGGPSPIALPPAPALGPAEWDALADAALQRVRTAGASYGDIRILDTTVQSIRGRDGRIAGVGDSRSIGFGVRVLHRGAWGFAASALLTEAEARRVADLALEIARGSASLIRTAVRLAPEPPHTDTVVTPRAVDPFTIGLDQKTALLLEVMERMQRQEGIARTSASLWTQRDVKLFASTDGARVRFDLLATHGDCGATAIHDGRFASREFNTPYWRCGYELIQDADLPAQATRVAAEAVEKVRAPAVDAGESDLVLDAEHLSLTIHESCGHPTELDRALGWEANYAGTSFLTPDQLGQFRYGSPQVTLVADNTEPGALASTGYDDDGVAAQRWPIIEQGVFVGYSDSRETAPLIGAPRARGSSRADSWASIPIVRIANIGLQPGDARLDDLIADVKNGIFIAGHGSFSIDQRRYNFQFGGDAFWKIENGRRTHMLRDVIYTGITPEFWNRCDAVADASHRRTYGFITCGKGQPGQTGWMTHAASPARFRGVRVIRGGAA